MFHYIAASLLAYYILCFAVTFVGVYFYRAMQCIRGTSHFAPL